MKPSIPSKPKGWMKRQRICCIRLLGMTVCLWTIHRMLVGVSMFEESNPSMATFTEESLLDSVCDQDLGGNKVVLDQILVSDTKTLVGVPKIVCFIMTHSGNHATRVKDVVSTWGKRCDDLILASNATDASINTIAMTSKATWKNLWQKLQETLQYISNKYPNDNENSNNNNIEWFLKADDDSYIIMENAKSFLSDPEIQRKHQEGIPLIFGRNFAVPLRKLQNDIGDKKYVQAMVHKFQWKEGTMTFRFPSGGASYLFNKAYLALLVDGIRDESTFEVSGKAKPPEDLSQALVAYEQSGGSTTVQPARDELRRERFHMFAPSQMYTLDRWQPSTWVYKFAPDGLQKGKECCSESSISFHQVDRVPGLMQYMERQLYACRRKNKHP